MWFDPIPQAIAAAPAAPAATPTEATVTQVTNTGVISSEQIANQQSGNDELPSTSPEESTLSVLKQGNIRFASGQLIHPDQDDTRRGFIASQPSPVAIVICCSDARVPPEIVLDQGLGTLFVIRTAGLVLGQAELATITYAVSKWNPPVVLALSHSQCAAVTEALDNHWFSSSLQPLLKVLQPRFASLPSDSPDKVDAAVRANTQYVMNQIHALFKDWKQRLNGMVPTVSGGIYDVNTGLVEWVEYTPPRPTTPAKSGDSNLNSPSMSVFDKTIGTDSPMAEVKPTKQESAQQPKVATPPKITLWCPRCLAGYPDTVQFCTRCGVSLVGPNARVKCANCGKVNTINAERCWNCQTPLHSPPSSAPFHQHMPTPNTTKATGCSTGIFLLALTFGSTFVWGLLHLLPR